jgi:hypothetical protein
MRGLVRLERKFEGAFFEGIIYLAQDIILMG